MSRISASNGRSGKGVDGEAGLLAGMTRADIGLVDRRHEFHVREVGGDDEQHRRLQRGGDRLAGIDRAGQHDAVDRGIDRALVEVGLLRTSGRPWRWRGWPGHCRAPLWRGRASRSAVSSDWSVAMPRVGQLLRRATSACFAFVERSWRPRHWLRPPWRRPAARSIWTSQLGGVELGQHVALLDLLVLVGRDRADDAGQARWKCRPG